jgi:hypothetical protein
MQINYGGVWQNHFLLFENYYGAGDLVNAEQLQIFMQST